MKHIVKAEQLEDADPLITLERSDGYKIYTRVSVLMSRFRAFQDIWEVVEKANAS